MLVLVSDHSHVVYSSNLLFLYAILLSFIDGYMDRSLQITTRRRYTLPPEAATSQQRLYLDGADAELMKGKRILIVDDVISTGESLKALEALVEKAGGEICGRMAILAEGDAIDRGDIIYLEPLPLFNADGTVLG